MKRSVKSIRVALAGNPNCGKSTLFNHLTGLRQHIGNYAGVTVEQMKGTCLYRDIEFQFVDLPGLSGFWSSSEEERAAKDYLTREPPDIIMNVLDSARLEKNLFLTLELKELGIPLLLVCNMIDQANTMELHIDEDKLSRLFHAPVLCTDGHCGTTSVRILEALYSLAVDKGSVRSDSDEPADELTRRINSLKCMEEGESEESIMEKVRDRYRLAGQLSEAIVRHEGSPVSSLSDRLDGIFLHRIWGIPLFLGMMYLVFQLTFTLGDWPMSWLEMFFEKMADRVGALFAAEDSLFRSFLIDGVIGGCGGVIVFLPNILFLFLAIALLEDSGYMARAAFLAHRFLSRIGLPGKSFIPLMIGFGCSVPAIMATRTLENRRDRLTAMFVIPLMSCGARVPIYALLIPAFFPIEWRAPVLWFVYMTGIVLAALLALFLKKTVFRGHVSPFVMELPVWHIPSWKTVGLQTLGKAWLYLRKAGTVILGFSFLLWLAAAFPRLPQEKLSDRSSDTAEAMIECHERQLEYSTIGRLGHFIEPVLKPMGADWKIGTAFLGAFGAKEVFVAQLGIIYKVADSENKDESLRSILTRHYSPLTGTCIILFCLIGMPCMATFAMIARESLSWRFALLQWTALTVLAWLIAVCVQQVGIRFLN
ncbi:MAG: ferrous iron transport protein B [Planctomycetia bacterium]|nr:ferrous iron transport protein B [Planctomycetia bacterium]